MLAVLTTKKLDCGIYSIKHVDSGKQYIGSSNSVKTRLSVHLRDLKTGRHPNHRLQNAWSKYGSSQFLFRKILVCAPENKLFYEQLIINSYETAVKDVGFNISSRVNSPMHDAETIEKMAKTKRGKPSPRKGTYISTEAKKRMSEISLARYKDPIFLKQHEARKLTHCKRGHEFKGGNLYIARDGERGCRACMRLNRTLWKKRNRDKHLALKKAYYERKKARLS